MANVKTLKETEAKLIDNNTQKLRKDPFPEQTKILKEFCEKNSDKTFSNFEKEEIVLKLSEEHGLSTFGTRMRLRDLKVRPANDDLHNILKRETLTVEDFEKVLKTDYDFSDSFGFKKTHNEVILNEMKKREKFDRQDFYSILRKIETE